MMSTLWSEWTKAWSVRSPRLCLIGTPLLAAFTGATLANDVTRSASSGEVPAGERVVVAVPTATGVAMSLLVFSAFAMLLVTSEYASGSIHTTLQAQPRRHLVLLGKAAVAAACGLVLGALTGALTYLGAQFLLGVHAAAGGLGPGEVALRSALVLAMAAVIAVSLGSLLRSSVGTLTASVVLLQGLVAAPPPVAVWTPAGAVQRLLSGDEEYYPAWAAGAVLALWAAVLAATAVILLRRRDA